MSEFNDVQLWKSSVGNRGLSFTPLIQFSGGTGRLAYNFVILRSPLKYSARGREGERSLLPWKSGSWRSSTNGGSWASSSVLGVYCRRRKSRSLRRLLTTGTRLSGCIIWKQSIEFRTAILKKQRSVSNKNGQLSCSTTSGTATRSSISTNAPFHLGPRRVSTTGSTWMILSTSKSHREVSIASQSLGQFQTSNPSSDTWSLSEGRLRLPWLNSSTICLTGL